MVQWQVQRLIMEDTPRLLATVKKKLNTLTLDYNGNELELNIVDGEIDIIKIDEWISGILIKEYEKINLRKRLSGDSGVSPFKSISS
jgi:hypothetical protein